MVKRLKKRIEDYKPSKFKKHFIFSQEVINQLWADLYSIDDGINEEHIIWTFDYLRYYTTFDEKAEKFNVSSRTYGDHVWKVIDTARFLLFQSQLANRFDQKIKDLTESGNTHSNDPFLTLAVDTTFLRTNTTDNSFLNPKYGHRGVKYEVGCSLYDGKVLW
ncbi:hypothetical protein DICPUDRAFT_82380, partial [Dictyostelium purpureum]